MEVEELQQEANPDVLRLMNVSVVRKVDTAPPVTFSRAAQHGYQFPDTSLIVMRG